MYKTFNFFNKQYFYKTKYSHVAKVKKHIFTHIPHWLNLVPRAFPFFEGKALGTRLLTDFKKKKQKKKQHQTNKRDR